MPRLSDIDIELPDTDPKGARTGRINIDRFELGIDPNSTTECPLNPQNEGLRTGSRKQQVKQPASRVRHRKLQVKEPNDVDDNDDDELDDDYQVLSPAQEAIANALEGENIQLVNDESSDTDLARAIYAILGDKDFRQKSQLQKYEVLALTQLLEISSRYKCRRLLEVAENFLALMVSFDRGSRKEMVAAMDGMAQMRAASANTDIVNKLRGVR